MQQKLLTPVEYAKLRGLNRSTISRQIRDGKIPVHGGKIDVSEADKARRENLDSGRSAEAGRRKIQRSIDRSPERDTRTVEGLLGAILEWRDRLPALFHAMGAPTGVALLSGEVLEALVLSVTGTKYGPIPGPTDFAAIAADLGVSEAELASIYDAQCERWTEALTEFFDSNSRYADGLAPITTEAGRR
jgi:hypothetical protein